MVNFYHACSYRGGNCNGFLSHTARWFSIANSTSKETVLLLGLLFLQTDFPFETGIMDDLVQG